MRVLLIGCGAIGGWVANRLADDPRIRITAALIDGRGQATARATLGADALLATHLDDLSGQPGFAVDVALECAGHTGLAQHGPAVLAAGIDLGIVSVGGLADDDLASRLEAAAATGQASLTILSGALPAVDALAAARLGGLHRVVYTARKPPLAWAGTPAEQVCALADLERATTLFEGSARDAAKAYPKNANAAATIALASLGLDATQVRLVADPEAAGNTHAIEATGGFGELAVTMQGRPLAANPKSSALAAMSAARFLRNRASAVRI